LAASRDTLREEGSICQDLSKQVHQARVDSAKNNSKLQNTLQDVCSLRNALEMHRNEESGLREGIVGERAKQQSLDALAGRLENHALNAEDLLQNLKQLKQYNKESLDRWAQAELARTNNNEGMRAALTAQAHELATLQREVSRIF